MGNTALLSGLIRWRQPDAGQIQRQSRRLMLLLIIWSIIAILIPLVIGAIALWNAWQAGQWDNFWDNTFLFEIGVPTVALIQPAIHISMALHRSRQAKQWAIQAQRLRQAAIDADEKLAPLASKQYEPLTTSAALSADPTRWGPLTQPPQDKILWMRVLSPTFLVLGGIFGLAMLAEWATLSESERLIVEGITALFLIPGLAALPWAIRMGKDIEVRSYEWHIEWKRLHWWGRTRARMDWQEARAFFTFTLEKKRWTGSSWEKARAYVLDGPKATLAWVDPEYYMPGRQDAHAPFCQLIAARTRLPLRDLSAAVEEAEKPAPDALTEWAARKAAEHDLAAPVPRKFPKPAQKPPKSLVLLILAPLLSLFLVAGVGWGLQIYELHQYAQMLAQIRAHKPLYYDALTAPDGDWVTKAPTVGDQSSFAFADGSYQLSGGYGLYALAPHYYADALLEVTVRLSDGNYFKSTSIGLVLHSRDPYNGLVFMVDPFGFWYVGGLKAYDEQVLGSASALSPEIHAINATPGAANRLDVIMRGNEYLCYVNDQLITIYHDTQNLTAPGGLAPVGIYTDGSVTASFNDFTVYPLD